jgi:hypothetical protein
VTVNIAEPGVIIEEEEKEAVAPAGKPPTLKLTVPGNPNWAKVETV